MPIKQGIEQVLNKLLRGKKLEQVEIVPIACLLFDGALSSAFTVEDKESNEKLFTSVERLPAHISSRFYYFYGYGENCNEFVSLEEKEALYKELQKIYEDRCEQKLKIKKIERSNSFTQGRNAK